MDSTDASGLVTQAYLYGFPLVFNLDQVSRYVTEGVGGNPAAPFNTFSHARTLAGPQDTFVTINNDTVYSMAQLDLSVGPVALHVPDTAERYYVLQFVDAWTNNFAYIGRRATGTGGREFLLVGPDDTTEAPDGMEVVRAPSGIVMVVGRVQINGPADARAVHALQDQFTLTPLNANSGAAAGLPEPDPRVSEDLRWWETLRGELAAFPPPAADAPFLAVAESLGLTASESPYVDPDPELAQVLIAGAMAGQETIEQLAKGGAPPASGWVPAMHYFDYNLDYFGVGTIDAPEWKIEDRM